MTPEQQLEFQDRFFLSYTRSYCHGLAKTSFIDHLRKLSGESPQKELPEFEYESKLDIGETNRIDDIVGIEGMLQFCTPPQHLLTDLPHKPSSSINHYFANGNDHIVVTEYQDGLFLKRKGPPEPLGTSIANQDWVLKRRELVPQRTNLEEIFQSIPQKPYLGTATKYRVAIELLDVNDGRIYECAISEVVKGTRTQRQLEIEYMGYISGIPAFNMLNSESSIVQGIVTLTEHLLQNKKLSLRPTIETKLDFVSAI